MSQLYPCTADRTGQRGCRSIPCSQAVQQKLLVCDSPDSFLLGGLLWWLARFALQHDMSAVLCLQGARHHETGPHHRHHLRRTQLCGHHSQAFCGWGRPRARGHTGPGQPRGGGWSGRGAGPRFPRWVKSSDLCLQRPEVGLRKNYWRLVASLWVSCEQRCCSPPLI